MVTWFKELVTRLSWASKIISDSSTIIKLDNGISLDISNNQIILDGDFALHTTGKLTFSSDKDVVLISGKMLGHMEGDILLNTDEIIYDWEVICDHEHHDEYEED